MRYSLSLSLLISGSALLFTPGSYVLATPAGANISEPDLRPAIRTSDFQPAPALNPKNLPDFARIQPTNNNDDLTEGNAKALPLRGSDGVVAAPVSSAAGTSVSSTTVGKSPSAPAGSRTVLQSEAASTTLPREARLKLVLETGVNAKTSLPGDIFEAHVKDDLFVGSSLILARGSQVRGRVAEVAKPKFISRAAKIGLRLDQIVTPSGEVIPLDAALQFRHGMTNKKGELDPGTNFGTRVDSSIKAASGMSSTGVAKGALVAANIATLGAPTIAAALGGSAIALFASGDNVDLNPGQEIDILLTNDLGVQIN